VTEPSVVQAAVDALAADLGCPVLVEDTRHQPLWWSVHESVDEVRMRSCTPTRWKARTTTSTR
jgi:hypothetical protein